MSIADRLQTVRQTIDEASVRSGRPADAVRLVGVSKGSPAEFMVEAVEAGLEDIGENRVQEAAAKLPVVAARVPTEPRWHLIGHLQSNEARAALSLFDTIQAVDSLRIAETLSRLATEPVPVFLEVQYQRTADRYGFDPDSVEEALAAIQRLPHLGVVGLMTVAPLGLDGEGVRRVFRDLRERRDRIGAARPEFPSSSFLWA